MRSSLFRDKITIYGCNGIYSWLIASQFFKSGLIWDFWLIKSLGEDTCTSYFKISQRFWHSFVMSKTPLSVGSKVYQFWIQTMCHSLGGIAITTTLLLTLIGSWYGASGNTGVVWAPISRPCGRLGNSCHSSHTTVQEDQISSIQPRCLWFEAILC